MKKRVAFKTLGCRLNQFETDALTTEFLNHNYEVVSFEKQADVYIVNACTVTRQSDKKVRYYVNHASKRKNGGILLLIGCFSKHDFTQTAIDYRVENNRKAAVFHIVDAHFKGEILDEDDCISDSFSYKTAKITKRVRTMVKIQDGCDNFCSFCIIPKVRGRAVSRPVKDILRNINELIDTGFKEIVITGVNISKYHYEDIDFQKLLSLILQVGGDFRIRISSIEPDSFHDSFYELFSHPKLTPFLHLCLQSGSDQVLTKMRRTYNVKQYMQIINRLRKYIPDINISTDIMVGFPGETPIDFQQTLHLMEEVKFAKVHTFRYSKRDKTPAVYLTGQIDEKEKVYRSQHVRELASKHQELYRTSFIKKHQRILVEDIKEGKAFGYGEHYIPIFLWCETISKNQFYNVKISGIDANYVLNSKF